MPAAEPVVVTAVFTPVEGMRDELVRRLEPAIAEVHQEDGCILYAIHDAPDGTIVMIERWASEDLLDAHSQGQAVGRLSAAIADVIASPVVVTRLRPIPAGTPEQGVL
ncbi:putative quinol monooxygenase [Lysobacter korlensis]|uniref:Quinol monooxygenase n=1 Tax=Lysobacter korlensis TaxID=553636 RepID=A0ABV6RNC8_9GAMM